MGNTTTASFKGRLHDTDWYTSAPIFMDAKEEIPLKEPWPLKSIYLGFCSNFSPKVRKNLFPNSKSKIANVEKNNDHLCTFVIQWIGFDYVS